MSWPPPRPSTTDRATRPWDPRSRADPNLVADGPRLVYVVIDEVIGGWVGLSVAPWPHADDEGRLRFDAQHRSLEVGTTGDLLSSFLAPAHGRMRSRPPPEVRIGTVFAARLKRGDADGFFAEWQQRPEAEREQLSDLGRWLTRPRDITLEARKVAKLAYYGAMLPVLPEEMEQRWNWGGLEE
ncbi:MAG: hypothetical protein ACRDJ5_11235 [Actinomycetota bacterium]